MKGPFFQVFFSMGLNSAGITGMGAEREEIPSPVFPGLQRYHLGITLQYYLPFQEGLFPCFLINNIIVRSSRPVMEIEPYVSLIQLESY